jgi:AcrR family transcriptional regulator
MTTTVTASRPTRRDAVRNRERIIKAASTVFAEKGLDVSMDSVAVAAGVGVGTVYRHFPRREALIAALFDDRLDEVVELARAAATDPDPWQGLTWFLEHALALEVSDRALSQVLADPALRAELLRRGSEDIRPAVNALVSGAQAVGALRRDVMWTDFILIQKMVVEVAVATRDTAPDAWRRMLTLCIDGLSNTHGRALPGSPLTPEQATNVRSGNR